MTRIGSTETDPGAALQHGRASDVPAERDGARRHGLSMDLGRDMRFGQFGLGAGAGDGEAAFEERLRRAMRDGGAPREDDRDDRERWKLLAAAGADLVPVAAHAVAVSAPTALSSADAADGRSGRIEALVQRVEQALAGEMRGERPAEWTLRLDLGAADLGLAGVTISLSREAINVVLSPASAELPPELAAAAQALADRLHQRFGRRLVRVHEAAPAGEGQGGMEAISSLLGRRDGRA